VIFAPPPAAPNAGHINTFVNSNNNHHLEKLKFRESLSAVMAQTRLVTDALSTEELQNERARRAYACGAAAVRFLSIEPLLEGLGRIDLSMTSSPSMFSRRISVSRRKRRSCRPGTSLILERIKGLDLLRNVFH